MTLPLVVLSALILMLQAQPASQEAQIPLDQILSARDLAKYKSEERYHSKVEILRKAIERRADHLPDQIEARDLPVISRNLAEIRGLTSSALEISLNVTDKDERRHKEVKKLEIELRKLSINLGDLSLAVPLEDRTQFETTRQLLEDLRNQLLRQLFGKAIGQAAPATGMEALPEAYRASRAGYLSTAGHAQGLWDVDKFTEDEFRRIQEAQKLARRVEVFLDIAEQRLNEIDRRRNGVEWDKEEPNPLEFYMYQEMLHAYVRALEGIMANIDSKARNGSESTKDVRKALEKLETKSTEFQSRLEEIHPFIREQHDRALSNVFDKAVETTTVAGKGARYGLEKLKDKD
ncbi:MAG: hypothetical protein P8020_00095 [Acidobacteriota bacterium]